MEISNQPLLLNDLLQLSDKDLEDAKVKLNQKNRNGDDPYEIYQSDPERINTGWLFWHKKRRYFKEGDIAICFVKMPNGYFLLTTIKKVIKDLGIKDGVNYDGYEIERYRHLFGKVVIECTKDFQSQGLVYKNHLKRFKVIESSLEKSKVMKSLSNRRMLFAHVAWMGRYEGLDGDKTQSGGGYGDRGNDFETKHEIYNFSENDGMYYGLAEPPQRSILKQIKLERIYNTIGFGIDSIDDVIVVFVARNPMKPGLSMVGFYNNARVYRSSRGDIANRWLASEKSNARYNLLCNRDDAFLLPEKERIVLSSIRHIRQPTVIYPKEEMKDEVMPYIEHILKERALGDNKGRKSNILSKEVKDEDVVVVFDKNKIDGKMPKGSSDWEHKYIPTKRSGTSANAIDKIKYGRKAEKYFIEFLRENGFEQGKDFFDVSNNALYGYDIKFGDIHIEIKNIGSGGFYLSDNEIGQLNKKLTRLVLVAVDKGIWVVKKDSEWLNRKITDIDSIRKYCNATYPDIDLTDIKINVSKTVEEESIEISSQSRVDIKSTFDVKVFLQ